MTTIIIHIALVILAVVMAYFAYRERARALATEVGVEIRRSVLRDCNAIMIDPHSSLRLKVFASHIATMAATSEFLFQLGTNPEAFSSTNGYDKTKKRIWGPGYIGLPSEAERNLMKPTITKLSLACLAFNSQHTKAIRDMVEANMLDETIDHLLNKQKPKHEVNTPRAQEIERVRFCVSGIERILRAELIAR